MAPFQSSASKCASSLSFLSLLFFFMACSTSKDFDILIQHGEVYDGSGAPGQFLDIGICNDKIVALGTLDSSRAKRIIDASGLVVAPGFIDTHLHLDPMDNLFGLSTAESSLRQGVTTALGGPDGIGVPLAYDFKAYLDTLETHGVGINMGFLTGHNKIRQKVMRMDNRQPTKKELDAMSLLVKQAMKEGAFGISTGLKYLPGNFAQLDEIIALSKVASNYGGVYTSHLRDEGLKVLEAIEEAIEISKKASIKVILTHHKVIGKPMWGKSSETLAMVDTARNEGVDILLDQYPYNASHTGLNVLIPTWARAGGAQAFKERVSNPSLRRKIESEIVFNILNDRGGRDLRRIQFARVFWKPDLEGKTLYDWLVAENSKPTLKNGAKFVIEAELKGGASCIFHAMDESDVVNIMRYPYTMIASDGRLSEPGVGHPHPRAYGTFPRVLGYYVREKKVVPLEEAIYKMTAFPAQTFGIKNRGQIQVGMVADLTLFNKHTVLDKATFTLPHQYPEGIAYVLVNGAIAVDNFIFKGIKSGKILRKKF